MADLTYGSLKTLANYPWLVKKFNAVEPATAGGTLPHGEARAPDMYWHQVSQAAGTITASEVSLPSVDATNVDVDCESNTSTDYFEVYCVWFSQSSGGLTNVS